MQVLILISGLFFGSFYNVVGLRLPKNESIVKPSSHCPFCNHKLSWYELIPVLSYIFLKGRCKDCHQKISIIYPLMELLTGVLFLISYLLFGLTENFYIAIILSSILVLIFISDSKYMIILDSPLIIGGILIFLIKFIYEGYQLALFSLLHGLVMFAFVYVIMLIGNFIFKKESLGGGDIKLSFIAGVVLGPLLGFVYLILGSFLAFPYAIYVALKNNDKMLPFGPFLATSLLIIFYNYNTILEGLKFILNI